MTKLVGIEVERLRQKRLNCLLESVIVVSDRNVDFKCFCGERRETRVDERLLSRGSFFGGSGRSEGLVERFGGRDWGREVRAVRFQERVVVGGGLRVVLRESF